MRTIAFLSTIALTTAIVLSGCSSKQGDVGNSNIRTKSVNHKFADDGLNEMNRMHGTQRMNNNVVGVHGNTHVELDQKIADTVVSKTGVKSAYVARTDHSAYVAVVTGTHPGSHHSGLKSTAITNGTTAGKDVELTDQIKTEIADIVKMHSPGTDQVYVSANPELGDRMKSYAAQVKEGHPLQGMLTEFNALVNRIFPESVKTNQTHENVKKHESYKP